MSRPSINESIHDLDRKVWVADSRVPDLYLGGIHVLSAGTVYIRNLEGADKVDIRNIGWIKHPSRARLSELFKSNPKEVRAWMTQTKVSGLAYDGEGQNGGKATGHLVILEGSKVFRRLQNVPEFRTLPDDHGIKPTDKTVPKGGLIFCPDHGFKRIPSSPSNTKEGLYNAVAKVLYPTLVMNDPEIKAWVTANPAPSGENASRPNVLRWYDRLMHRMLADKWVFLEYGRVWASDAYSAQALIAQLPRSALNILTETGWNQGVAVTLFSGRDGRTKRTMSWWELSHRTESFSTLERELTDDLNRTLAQNEEVQRNAERQALIDLRK